VKKTERIRYEVDPHNRLVSEKTGKESEVPGFRTILDGTFEIDKDNCVTYHVKKSQGYDTPQQIKLRGKWALDDEHNRLMFNVQKEAGATDRIILQGAWEVNKKKTLG
jgi:hypothetical protein